MLVPNLIDSFESQGEKLLFNKFKAEFKDKRIFILHSVFIQRHIKNMSGELDFLLLIPNEGFFTIEVKHGAIGRQNGMWRFIKNGKLEETNKSPFLQVSTSMNSLRKYIDEKLSSDPSYKEKYRKFMWGTAVAFTSIDDMPDVGQEGYPWQVILRTNLFKPLSLFIDNLSKNWHRENNKKKFYDFNNSRPSLKDCERILKIIRGDFDIDYTPLNRILNSELQIKQFTEEQLVTLNIVETNQRSLIQGAAGTGKSIIAIEQVRRCIERNVKFAFFCYNKKLGEHIRTIFNYSHNSAFSISTFHSFLSKNITNTKVLNDYDSASDEFFEDLLPIAFLLDNQIVESEKYDLIIIDEAQDLIKENYLDVFDSILKGGLRDGSFTLYGDFTNQSIYNDSKDRLIDLLRSRAYFTIVPELTVNCRNTQKISLQNHLMTRLPKPSNYDTQLDGEEISIFFVNDINLVVSIQAEIQDLLFKNIELEKISILSFKSLLKSSLSNSSKLDELRSKGLTISTVYSYKGLENTIVFLVDLPDLSDPKSINLLYIGISRARLKLYIFIHETMKSELRKLLQKHINS